jgi:PAS domain S-box-containing protein
VRLDEDTRAVLDACSDAVLGIDREGDCVVANAAAAMLFGYPDPHLLGLGAHRLVPALADAVTEVVRRRRAGEYRPGPIGPGIETIGRRYDGTSFPAQVWITPAYPDGSRLTLFVTLRDLSAARATAAAHRALLEDVTALRDTVSAIGVALRDRAILLTDTYGHVTMANRAAEKLLGYRADDIVGKSTTALYDPEDIAAARAELRTPPGADPLLELTRAGLPAPQNWTLLSRDGDRRPVTMSMTVIGDRDAPTGFVVAVTARRTEWEPLVSQRSSGDRLLLDLDDAETRTLRWQVGGSGLGRKR